MTPCVALPSASSEIGANSFAAPCSIASCEQALRREHADRAAGALSPIGTAQVNPFGAFSASSKW